MVYSGEGGASRSPQLFLYSKLACFSIAPNYKVGLETHVFWIPDI